MQALLARELAPQPTDAVCGSALVFFSISIVDLHSTAINLPHKFSCLLFHLITHTCTLNQPATPAVLNAIQYAQLGKAPTHVIVVGNALAAVHGHLTAAAVPLSTVRLQVVVVSHTPADSEAQVQMAAAVHKICHNSGGLYITLGAGTAPKALAQSLQPLLEQQLALPSAGLELGDTRTAVYLFPAPHLISAATPFSARHTSATIRILAFVGEEEDTKIKAALQLDAVPVIAWSTALLVPIAAATPGPSSLLYRALALYVLSAVFFSLLFGSGPSEKNPLFPCLVAVLCWSPTNTLCWTLKASLQFLSPPPRMMRCCHASTFRPASSIIISSPLSHSP